MGDDTAKPAGLVPRVAHTDDATRVVEVITLAFNRDPVWGWVFPDDRRRVEQHRVFWRPFVEGALPHEWVWMTADGGAIALWLPPGRPEIPPEAEAKIEPMLIELLGPSQAAVVIETFERFDQAHPADPPHYYLSLLGTHPDHRGRGIGMDLVAANLEILDAAGMPAYLESTNPCNNERYRRAGFEQVGEFNLPMDGPKVATMWREPRL
jgi:GNAT superfamily N-acetyltransferase